jgi:ribonuclease G
MHEVLLNVESKEIRYAHLKNGQLHDLVYDRKKTRQMKGNIYRGKVINIIPNMESAFVDFSEGGNGFIHLDDLLGNARPEEMQDVDFDDEEPKKEKHGKGKEIKVGQSVLVQVHKEPIGSKGARLTSNISLAGRYLVLLPNSSHRGVSRKIEERSIRDRLKKLLRTFELPQHIGVICRTSGAEASNEALFEEASELLRQWESISEKFDSGTEPAILYEESDLIKRSVMQCVDKKFDRLLVDDLATHQRCKQLYQKYEHEHHLKIELYRDKVPMFERFNVEREIEKALKRKVWLGSGGYLFFDRTEAMYTVDVNSGRSSQNPAGGDVEETLVRINLEAAEEIARQLRLRNVGGLIVCDFIDMRLKKNQRRVLDRIKDCMKEDSAKCTILGMSEFGLVEMTRQRTRESLSQTIHTACPYCVGHGVVKSHESVTVEIERDLKKLIFAKNQYALKLVVHPELNRYLNNGEKDYYLEFAEKSNAHLEFAVNDTLHISEYQFYSTTNGQKIET